MRHLTPDHPDFERVAATITPVERVHKESYPRTKIYAEAETSSRQIAGHRRESSNKI